MHCLDFDCELDFDLHLDLDLMELYFDFGCLYFYLVDFDYKVCQLDFGFCFGFGLMLIVTSFPVFDVTLACSNPWTCGDSVVT